MKPGTIVKDKNGRQGVVTPDLPGMMNCNGPGEISVEYEGDAFVQGTQIDDLVEVGPENPVPDLHECGAGQGADCCLFLTAGAAGPCCERHTSLRWTLIFKTGMTAARHPTEAYPDCMIFPKPQSGK